MNIFWHTSVMTPFELARDSGKLSHALLVTANEGLGIAVLGERMASSLLCQGEGLESSAHHRMVSEKVHPDLHWLAPDPNQITVDQIRRLSTTIYTAPSLANHRVIVIESAQQMNLPAMNALLKLLEEPPLGTHFILLCPHETRLLETIRSRCIHFALTPPPFEEGLAWLQAQSIDREIAVTALTLAQDAPLLALQLCEEGHIEAYNEIATSITNDFSLADYALSMAKRFSVFDGVFALDIITHWCQAVLLKLHSGQASAMERLQLGALTSLLEKADEQQLWKTIAQIVEHKRAYQLVSTLHMEYMLENALRHWQQVFVSEA